MANDKTSETSGEGILEILRAQHEAVFGEAACPQWVKDSCKRFVEQGIPTGDFMRAVLANDLMGAFGRADIETAKCMAAIVGYVYTNVPMSIIGSYAAVDLWVSRKLAERREQWRPTDEAPPAPTCGNDDGDLGPCTYEPGHSGIHSWSPF
jgi:hypothetical protein